MSSEQILFVNAGVFTIILLFFYKKNKLSLGFLIWSIYCLSAWFSYFFVKQPMYSDSIHVSTQTIFPCVYLTIIIFLCIYPLTRISKIEKIYFSNHKALKIVILICIFFQLVFVVYDIPSILYVLNSNMELGELRDAAYGVESDEITVITKNPITNRMFLLYTGMKPLATGLSVILLFCYKKERTLCYVFASTTFLDNLRFIIVTVGRGQLVMTSAIYVLTLFLIRSHLTAKIRRLLVVYTFPVIVGGILFVGAITISRFGDFAMFYIFKYLGEPINNFNGILFNEIKGYTGGRAYFSYIYRYLLGENTFVNVEGKYELIEKITGITPFIFYTFVGGLVMEFGKTVPVLFAIACNRFNKKIARKHIVSLDVALLYVFFIYFFVFGVFVFPIQNFDGFSLIYLIIFYFLFGKKVRSKMKYIPYD